ncbi:unnamed protein product [Rotaria sordida]|uniref:TAF6 C-terminal HEAT repeat domain-containing protein n=2 Tax=Rotaria sordida TaxID=392033 RepID=A0A813MQD6_9BILA|nr:unnamed protein product [Rotaria sordida]
MAWLETLPDDWWNQYQSISLLPECIQELNIELLFLVRSLILETRTYARVCKRICLLANDFQTALDTRNIHRYINLTNNIKKSKETNISVLSLLNQTDQISSKIDRLQLTIHWLAIDGEQPIISENPLPSFIEENLFENKQQKIIDTKIIPPELSNKSPLLKKLFEMASSTKTRNYKLQDHVHPLTKNNLTIKSIHPRNVSVRRPHINNDTVPSLQSSQACLAHELSIEQQLYFKLLTESCFNGTDKQSTDAFHCFSSDAALQPLLSRLLLFIAKGIETNIHLHDLNFIIRFLSILKMLTINKFILFDKYLHSIIPTLLTCLICIFDMSKNDNILSTIDHNAINSYSTIWIVREQASDLISYFENKYSYISYFTERIISIIKSNLIINNTTKTFSIVYACIRTLLLINIQVYGSFVIDILQNYKKTKIFEADFDLDYNEQQTIFNQKINELLEKYNLILEDI